MSGKDWPNYNKSLINKVVKTLTTGKINYTSERYGKIFEKKFSNFVGNKYSVAICNGTVALEIAIKSLKIPKGSEILVTARSFFSSASCIVNTGNKPVFLDVNLFTQNISIEEIKRKITKKTKVIICVHLGGLPCDMREIKKICKISNIKIIEDCSQAHGASIDGKQVGSFGDVSTWSFCTDKIISTLGEGGMISTNNKFIYKFALETINHGSVKVKNQNLSEKFIYNKNSFGSNFRITEIQSLAGIEQLKNLKKTQKIREQMAKDFSKIVSNYKNKINYYFPKKNIKSAWYRFYFFINQNFKNKNKLRLEIITQLKKKNIRVYTGSCPEIYLEKSFKKLKNFSSKRLINCKILGETSVALDVNHTLTKIDHKINLIKINNILNNILNKK
jgi:dTDP-4-amino-4,6-dideoxygalactose transaminase